MRYSMSNVLARAVAALLCYAIAVFGQFNDALGKKLEAKLKRKHPPEYFVIGTAVKLQVGTQIASGRGFIELLRARLESGLFTQDSRLKSEEARPETIIACEITRLDADDSRWDQRTTNEMQKTGTKQEWNAKKNKYETKDVYGTVPVTRRYRIVKGGIHISYHARDAKTKQTLDAQNVQVPFSQEYLDGNGSPSEHDVREMLVNKAVKQLVKRLTPTMEPLTVYLPRGKVENFSKLGQAGLWEKMREGLDKLGTLPKTSDEAYKQFSLGVANEALAYQAEKIEDSIKLFEEAFINYNKALELKPDEKYFREPMARIEQSLAQYKKLASQQAPYAYSKSIPIPSTQPPDSNSKGPKPTAQSLPQRPTSPGVAPANSKALTNQKVIEMVAAELDEAGIIDTIKNAPAVQFNLSADGQIDLKKNKVSNGIIGAMNERQNKQMAISKRPPTASRPKDASPSPTSTKIERHPSIDCPDSVVVDQNFVVLVSLSQIPRPTNTVIKTPEGTRPGPLLLSLPTLPNQVPWKIEVVLTAPGFEFIDGRNLSTIEMTPLTNSTNARFNLRAKSIPGETQRAEISATLWYNGNFLGQISRTVEVLQANKVGDMTPGMSQQVPRPADNLSSGKSDNQYAGRSALKPQSQESGQPYSKEGAKGPLSISSPAILAIDLNRKTSDLTICVKERFGGRTATKAEIEIHSPYLQTATSTFEIGPDMERWLESQYETFAKYGVRDLKKVEVGTSYPTNAYTDALLQGFGRELYKRLAPRIFQDAFWKLVDMRDSKFTSIQIISDNPTIPWELMRPARSDKEVERGFLGVEFNIGRWHLAEGVKLMETPPQWLTIDSLSVIAPQYNDKATLRYQSNEVQALKQMRGYRSVRGRFPEVQKLFAGRPEGIIHFAGHAGVLPSNSPIKDFAIQLEDGPLNVTAWQGLASQKLMSAHPFFFFNACHIGQTQRVANFVNGWAPAVLDAGASGYVGALWPINDRGAYEFAAKFYEILEAELKRGPISVAEVLRRTRETFVKNGDPTFLAYVYYGDPNLTFYAQARR